MAVKDIRSNLQETIALFVDITGDGTDFGAALDTADFELGLMFSVAVTAFGAGTFTLTLEQASNNTFTEDLSEITGDQLIGDLPEITGVTAQGAILETVGVISNLQFVRANVTAVGASGNTIVVITATQKAENMPVIPS